MYDILSGSEAVEKTCTIKSLAKHLSWIGVSALLTVVSSVVTAVILTQKFNGDINYLNREIEALKKNASQDGAWSTWESWSMCSTTCGGGIKERNRSCDNPAPSLSGKACTGPDNMYVSCNTQACPEPLVYFTANYPTQTLVSGRPIFETVIANVGGAYNQTTGLIVCPISGLYQFYFSFMHPSSNTVSCYLYHNDSKLTRAVAGASSDGHYKQTSASVNVELKQGDTFYAGGCVNWNYVSPAIDCLFTGSLIHIT